jgi:hypothetical protein
MYVLKRDIRKTYVIALNTFSAGVNNMDLNLNEYLEIQTPDGSSRLKINNVEGKLKVSSAQNLAPKLRDTVIDYLNSISDDYRFKWPLLQMYEKWKALFEMMPAGAKHHHTYAGGLSKHTTQVISTAIYLYELRKDVLGSQVSRDDIIISGFLHDLSKVQVYRRLPNKEEIDKNGGFEFTYDNKIDYLDMESWTIHQCMTFGIVLSEAQINALYFAEGGFSMWGKAIKHPKWHPLAVLISSADLYSACAIKS